ncbi:MAG TPA: molybdopterin cofactor-binding domain-containing protein, partial [Candidatus Binatia bacterium]|nr:molybdopterin cofactor-binding domain-containing protein [Candidatus Binatia bacterium]
MPDFIGSRTRSKEGPRHVSGRGLYTDDFILPGMLQAMILRSPHAHAKILSVDASQALTNPNVIAVITPDDIKQSTKPFKPGRYAAGLKRPIDEYAGAVDKVRYVGEPLGAVAARDRGSAEDALELISVEYEPIRPVVDVREAIKPSSATLFEELGSNLAWHGSLQYGDIDGAFKSADRVVKENLKIHRYSSTPLEPFVVIASYDAASKRLTVWVTAQVPEVIYDGLREALGLQD